MGSAEEWRDWFRTCWHTYRRPSWVWVHWAVSITVILLFFMAYGIVFGLFRARGSDSQLVSMSDGNMLQGEVTFGVRVLGFQYGVSANLQFSPLSFPPGFTTPDGRLAVDSLGVQINGVKYSYANGTVPGIIIQNIGYTSGDSQDYPFDSYSAPVTVYVWRGNPVGNPKIGLHLNVTSVTINALRFDAVPANYSTAVITYNLNVSRTSVGQVYPVFLIVAFWLIASALGFVACSIIIHEYRRVEAPVISLFSGSLFAVPALRNTAPLSPPFGCTLDYSSFFWCMLVCVLGFFGMVGRYIYQSTYPPFPVRIVPYETADNK